MNLILCLFIHSVFVILIIRTEVLHWIFPFCHIYQSKSLSNESKKILLNTKWKPKHLQTHFFSFLPWLGRIADFQTVVWFLQVNFMCCHLLMPHWIAWIFAAVPGSGTCTSGRHMASGTDVCGVRGHLGPLMQTKDEKLKTTQMNKPRQWLHGWTAHTETLSSVTQGGWVQKERWALTETAQDKKNNTHINLHVCVTTLMAWGYKLTGFKWRFDCTMQSCRQLHWGRFCRPTIRL